jgi:uncharacterized protein YkwD
VTSAAPVLVHRAMAAAIAALLVLAALVTGALTAQPAGAGTVEDAFTAKLNAARTSRDIPRLAVRADLVSVARAQARRMAAQDVLFHNPNLTTDVKGWRWVGENVGYGSSATVVHSAFMHSAPHKANILDRDYTQVGIGAVTKNGRVWVAQVFRRPMNQATSSSWTQRLQFGSTGSAVQRVQRRLGLRATGVYGLATRNAVARFQRSLGWAGHGIVGAKTWHRLF